MLHIQTVRVLPPWCPMCGAYHYATTADCLPIAVQQYRYEQIESPLSVGWECPRCHRVYAPVKQECTECNDTLQQYTGSLKEQAK